MRHFLLIVTILLCSVSFHTKCENQQNRQMLIMLDEVTLNRIKSAIKNQDKSVMLAYQRLIKISDSLLNIGPFSVMSKKQMPPSGNKHDYVSRGPYWWPDTSKTDGLPYIRKDGQTNPEVYDFTDHTYIGKVSNMVYTLGLAYFFSEDEKYAEHAALLLKTWFLNEDTKMNPHLNYGQQIPGICEGRGIGLIDTRGMADMLDGVILLQSSKAWTSKNDYDLKKWFSDFYTWMTTNPIGLDEAKQHNNHGTYYDVQKVAYAIYTGHTDEAKKQLLEVTRKRLDNQLESDGSQPFEMARTKPWGYCSMNLSGFVRLAIIGDKIGVNLWNYQTPKRASIRKAIEWYFPYLSKEKEWPKAEITGKIGSGSMLEVLMKGSSFDIIEYKKQIDNLLSFTNDNYNIQTSILQLTYPIIEGPITDDKTFFNEVLDLNYPGLEKVKDDINANNYNAAKTDFVSYIKSRQKPIWFFDWHDFNKQGNRDSNYDTSDADKITSNLLISCGISHQFGDTIDWAINPTPLKYNEWTWQLSRHPFWVTLGKAYWATGDEIYAKAFVKQMRGWVKTNPLPDHAANVPYSRWRTIETGIRTSGSWPNSFFYFLGSPSFDDESIIMMIKSFYEHGMHLRTYPQKNNWLTMEMNGLFHIGILFPEFKKSKEWCEYSSKRLHEEKKNQIYPDGAQVELATGYHYVSLRNFLGIYRIASLNKYKLPDDYVTGLESMFNYYLNICMPDGCMPALNDAGWGDSRKILAEGFSLLPKRTDFEYVATKGEKGTKPNFTSTWMPWAGWYIMRSGWDENALYAHFEVGPYGAAHQHEDKLSIILSAYGNRILTEGGTYAYDTSQWRKYILSARAHNVTRIDGNDQNRNARRDEDEIRHSRKPLTNRWITNNDFDFGEGWYNEGFGSKKDTTVTQYRALLFIKNRFWIMFDVFTPNDKNTHKYETFFHLNASDFKIDDTFYTVQSKNETSANLAITPLYSKDITVDIVKGQETPDVQGWIPAGGTDRYACKPIATPIYKREASGQCINVYLLYPLHKNEDSPINTITQISNTSYKFTLSNEEEYVIDFSIKGDCIDTLNYTVTNNKKTVLHKKVL